MNIDKKSIIQTVILVVLLAVAGGAYLMSQEGGLGSITSLITDLLPGAAEEKKQPEPMPVAAPAKPAEPTIPAQPAKGQVAGQPFEPEAVMLEGGVLAFVQSKEPQSAILIRLSAPKWETPGGKKFKYAPASGANVPVVAVNRMDGGEMKQQSVADKYTLTLEFDQEKERKLPGKIYLALAGDPKTAIAGTFSAEIKGFRIVDGKPDLSSDSTDTLEYLALKELLKDDPDKQIDVVAFRDGRFSSDASEKNRVGYLEVEYRAAQTPPEIKRFQFVKNPEWRVQGTLALNQIDEAHPMTAPSSKDKPERVLPYFAANQLEGSIKKKSPTKGIYGTGFVTRYSVKNKIGVVEVSYKLDPGTETLKTAYLYRLNPNGWTFNRELGPKEKVNVDTGKIEKK